MESGENGQTDTEPGIGYHIIPHMYWGRSIIMIYIHFIETQFLQAVVFTTDCPLYLNFILSDSNTAEMSIFLHETAFYQIKNTKKKCNIIL